MNEQEVLNLILRIRRNELTAVENYYNALAVELAVEQDTKSVNEKVTATNEHLAQWRAAVQPKSVVTNPNTIDPQWNTCEKCHTKHSILHSCQKTKETLEEYTKRMGIKPLDIDTFQVAPVEKEICDCEICVTATLLKKPE